jgi:ABC-type lipoprotein release transport system permease subunit
MLLGNSRSAGSHSLLAPTPTTRFVDSSTRCLYLAVSALLIAIAALAVHVPARRAARLSPSVAFRHD